MLIMSISTPEYFSMHCSIFKKLEDSKNSPQAASVVFSVLLAELKGSQN